MHKHSFSAKAKISLTVEFGQNNRKIPASEEVNGIVGTIIKYELDKISLR
jgi:hypothetical protein